MRNSGKPWTAKDLETLKAYSYEGTNKLSERLGRSRASVKQKAYRYGLSLGRNALMSPQSLSICKECRQLVFIVDGDELCLKCKLQKEEQSRRQKIETELNNYKTEFNKMDARVRKAKSRAKQKLKQSLEAEQ